MEVWECKQCDHAEASRDAIESHISTVHPDSCDLTLDRLTEFKQIRRNLANQKCPFCMKIPGTTNFMGHICHHLEDVALFAIPRDAIEHSDKEDSAGFGSVSTFESASHSIKHYLVCRFCNVEFDSSR